MKPDIQSRLKADFGADVWLEVIRIIHEWDADAKGLLDDRLLRAVIYLSYGDRDEFLILKEISRHQYQDVLDLAEYDGATRVRDFAKQFGQEVISRVSGNET